MLVVTRSIGDIKREKNKSVFLLSAKVWGVKCQNWACDTRLINAVCCLRGYGTRILFKIFLLEHAKESQLTIRS